MKVHELAKQLNITPRDIVDYLQSLGDNTLHSHLQVMTDEQIDKVTERFANVLPEEKTVDEEVIEPSPIVQKKAVEPVVSSKQFRPEDMIPCRSVCPWKLNALSVDKNIVYHWENWGDVEYVPYRDLMPMRRKPIITAPHILIEDPDLCDQWKRDLGESYRPFTGVDYPEQLFEVPDEQFRKTLQTCTQTLRDIIRVTAVNMIKAQNYPTVQKINIIDEVLGTCIKEFM